MEIAQTLQHADAGRRIIRRTKINRTDRSYRPGLPLVAAPTNVAREIDLHFVVHTVGEVGTDEELAAVKSLRDALRARGDVVSKANISEDIGKFTVVCRVHAPATSDDDLLTDVFLRLQPTLDHPTLRDPLASPRPRWQAVKGGDFVADEGIFN